MKRRLNEDKNVLTKVVWVVCCIILMGLFWGCVSYYGVELQNKSPRLTKETTLEYGQAGKINKGRLDPGLTPYGTYGGKHEAGKLGPTPEEATVSWVEESGVRYQVTVKVLSVVKTPNPEGTVVFTIQPDRSVTVTHEPKGPRLKGPH